MGSRRERIVAFRTAGGEEAGGGGGGGGGPGQERDHLSEEKQRAIECECRKYRACIEILSHRAMDTIEAIKKKADASYERMNAKLGESHQQEICAIDNLKRVMMEKIETEEMIASELLISGGEFLIDDSNVLFENTEGIRALTPVQDPVEDQFTVVQVVGLLDELRQLAPSGFVSSCTLMDLVHNMCMGQNLVPKTWVAATISQLQHVCSVIDSHKTDYLDWRLLVTVLLLQSSGRPTFNDICHYALQFAHQMPEAVGMDQAKVSKQGFDTVRLWFEYGELGNTVRTSEHFAQRIEDITKEMSDLGVRNPGNRWVGKMMVSCTYLPFLTHTHTHTLRLSLLRSVYVLPYGESRVQVCEC